MRSKVSLLVFLVLITNQVISYAQQDAQWSHYMFNGIYYNPGYSGIEKAARFTLISRKQWLGYSKNSVEGDNGTSPMSNILSFNTRLPLLNGRTGVGGFLIYDTKGPIASLEFQPSAAYHIPVANGLLGIGVRVGIINQRLNAKYRVPDETDPIYIALTSNTGSQTKLDYTTGVWYEKTRWYAGASVNHLSRSKFSYGLDSVKSILNNHMHITGGYRFQVSSPLVITPSAIIQTDFKQLTFVMGPMATYNEKYWVGINARQSMAKKDVSVGGKTWAFDDVIFYLGMSMLKNNSLRAGYSFDLVTTGKRAKAGTSHEIMLSYMLPPPGMAKKPPVRTPRYRHEEN